MAGLLAVIAVAAPNIPGGKGDQVRADLTFAEHTGAGDDGRPDRLAFDDHEPGLDIDANILSPVPEDISDSDTSSPNPDRSTTTTSVNADPRPSTTTPSPTDPSDNGNSGHDGDDADGTGGPNAGDDTESAVDGDIGEGGDPAADGTDSFVERYYNDFSLGELDIDNWELHDGRSPTGFGPRRPSAVSVVADEAATGGHMLQITATMGTEEEGDDVVSGAMTLIGFGQTYGRYSARVRIDGDPDQVTSGALVLGAADTQPQDERLSFFETWANRSTRTPVEAYLHPGSGDESPFLVRTHTGISGTDWHIYRVDWRKDRVTVTVDGEEPVLLSIDPTVIPDRNLELTIRLDAYDSPLTPDRTPTVTRPISLQVDWLRVEFNG